MKIYSFKIALHGVNPMIWRHLRVADDTSLASLHYIIEYQPASAYKISVI